MSNSVISYTALDLHSLEKKNIKVRSSDEALKDIIPITWGEDVLQGKKRIVATKKRNEGK